MKVKATMSPPPRRVLQLTDLDQGERPKWAWARLPGEDCSTPTDRRATMIWWWEWIEGGRGELWSNRLHWAATGRERDEGDWWEQRWIHSGERQHNQANKNTTNQPTIHSTKFWCQFYENVSIMTSVFFSQLVIEWRFINRVRRQMDQVDISRI